MSGQTNSAARLGFLDIAVFDDGSIRGGILVTDMETRPLEFRVTTPVKPTQMQRILYGNTLSKYVYGELIGYPLVKIVKEKLSLLIAKNENLLIMRPKISIPLVVITKEPKQLKTSKSGGTMDVFSFKPHPKYASEGEIAKKLIDELSERCDPFEPFERLKIAMDEVHKQKPEEK